MKGSRLKYLLKVFSVFSVERTLRSLILFELLFLRNCREHPLNCLTNSLIVQILLTKISTLWSCLGSLSFEAHSEVTAHLSYHLQAFLSSTFFKVFNFASGGAVSLRQLYYYITPNSLCQYPFLSFFTFLCFFLFFLSNSPFFDKTKSIKTNTGSSHTCRSFFIINPL